MKKTIVILLAFLSFAFTRVSQDASTDKETYLEHEKVVLEHVDIDNIDAVVLSIVDNDVEKANEIANYFSGYNDLLEHGFIDEFEYAFLLYDNYNKSVVHENNTLTERNKIMVKDVGKGFFPILDTCL